MPIWWPNMFVQNAVAHRIWTMLAVHQMRLHLRESRWPHWVDQITRSYGDCWNRWWNIVQVGHFDNRSIQRNIPIIIDSLKIRWVRNVGEWSLIWEVFRFEHGATEIRRPGISAIEWFHFGCLSDLWEFSSLQSQRFTHCAMRGYPGEKISGESAAGKGQSWRHSEQVWGK